MFHNSEIEMILKGHGIRMFEFIRDDLFTFTLRTNEPVTDNLRDDLKMGIRECITLKVEKLMFPPTVTSVMDPYTGTSLVTPKVESNVNHPSHYNSGKIEVIEAIEDWKLGFDRGNAVKYIARAGKKDPTKEIEDLEKARWYLNRSIELLTAGKEKRNPVRPNDMNPRTVNAESRPNDFHFFGEWVLSSAEGSPVFLPHGMAYFAVGKTAYISGFFTNEKEKKVSG